MAVALNDLFNVQIRGTVFGQRVMLTHWYALSNIVGAPPSELTASLALGNELIVGGSADLVSPYAACLPPDYTFDSLRVQKVAPVRFRFVNAAIVGTGTHASGTEAS